MCRTSLPEPSGLLFTHSDPTHFSDGALSVSLPAQGTPERPAHCAPSFAKVVLGKGEYQD
jgi:hypothetical protein